MQCPPRPGPGIKRMEAEGLGRGGFDDFPDIDSHAQAEQLEFVDQGDVHAAVNVFEQLGHLRRGRRGNRDDAVEDRAIERGGQFARLAGRVRQQLSGCRGGRLSCCRDLRVPARRRQRIRHRRLRLCARLSARACCLFRESGSALLRWCRDRSCSREPPIVRRAGAARWRERCR